MRFYLKENSVLMLGESKYRIEKILGEGALSVAYKAVDIENGVKHVIKEYNPLQISINRKKDGTFELNKLGQKENDKYNAGLKRFEKGAQKQINIRNNTTAMNVIIPVNKVYKCNNTAYIDMSINDGDTYAHCEEKSLIEVLEHIKSISDAISIYHENGFLYLDIKPSNIFVLNHKETILFFDFDSVVEKSEFLKGNELVPYSMEWSAPEQINDRYYKDISEQSDIFSIGEILFHKLFGRHSDITERWSLSEYDFSEVKLYPISDLRVQEKLKDILRKTINVDNKKRYKTCKNLSDALEDVIKIINKGEIYLYPSKLIKTENFFGRESEIEWINKTLTNGDIAILSGIGGIGKTEICREYTYRYNKAYDCIIFIHENYSWRDIVNKNLIEHLHNFSADIQREIMREDELFDCIIRTIQALRTERTLFVLDNLKEDAFSEKELEYRKKVLNLPGKFLITTRAYSEAYPCRVVGPLDHKSLINVYYSKSGGQNNTEKIVELMKSLGNHTLLVSLVASYVKNSFSDCNEMIEKIMTEGLLSIGDKLRYTKYSGSDPIDYNQDLVKCLMGLSDIEKMSCSSWNIMYCLSLLPLDGIEVTVFQKLLNKRYTSNLHKLINTGWVTYKDKMISLHPCMIELCAKKGIGKAYGHVFCYNLYKYLECVSSKEKKKVGQIFIFCIDKLIERKENDYSFLKLLSLPPEYYLNYTHNYRKIENYNRVLLEETKNKKSCLKMQLTGLLNLSEIQCAYGDTEQTKSILNKVLEIIHAKSKEKPRDLREFYIRAYLIYGYLYNSLNEIEEANNCFDNAMNDLNFLQSREYLYAEAYKYLGMFYSNKSEYKKAIDCYEMSLEKYTHLYGNHSYQTSSILCNLADVTRTVGNMEDAIKMVEQAVGDMVIIFDSDYNELLKKPCVLLLSMYLLSGDPENYIKALKRYGHCLHSSQITNYDEEHSVKKQESLLYKGQIIQDLKSGSEIIEAYISTWKGYVDDLTLITKKLNGGEPTSGHKAGYQAYKLFEEQKKHEIEKICYDSWPLESYCEEFIEGWYDALVE